MAAPHLVLYVDGIRRSVSQDPREALAAARAAGGLLWVSIVVPQIDQLHALGDAFDLEPLGVASMLRNNQRSKLDHYGDHLYLALQPAQYDDAEETVECHEVDVATGDDFLIVVSPDASVDLDGVRALLEEHPEVLRKGSYGVLWATFEYVTRGYRDVLDGIEHDIDEIEEQIFGDDEGVSHRIFALQREVIDLHHATEPLEDMLQRIHRLVERRRPSGDALPFHEIAERARYVDQRVASFRQTLDSALTVHSTLVDQRRNDAMQRMTEQSIRQNDQVKKISSWAAIGFAPTLVAGIYGMNFRYMPELEWTWGYPLAIALMVGVSAGLYFLFKRNDWL